MLVDVVLVICGGQHLGLVDVVDVEGLQDLGLDKVANTALGLWGGGEDSGKWAVAMVSREFGSTRSVKNGFASSSVLTMTGIETASMISLIMAGSDILATPPCTRISAGTRSRAMTAQAPASSAIRACSTLMTS